MMEPHKQGLLGDKPHEAVPPERPRSREGQWDDRPPSREGHAGRLPPHQGERLQRKSRFEDRVPDAPPLQPALHPARDGAPSLLGEPSAPPPPPPRRPGFVAETQPPRSPEPETDRFPQQPVRIDYDVMHASAVQQRQNMSPSPMGARPPTLLHAPPMDAGMRDDRDDFRRNEQTGLLRTPPENRDDVRRDERSDRYDARRRDDDWNANRDRRRPSDDDRRRPAGDDNRRHQDDRRRQLDDDRFPPNDDSRRRSNDDDLRRPSDDRRRWEDERQEDR